MREVDELQTEDKLLLQRKKDMFMKVSRYSEFISALQKIYSYDCEVCLNTPVASLFAVCKSFDLLKAE